MVVIPILLILGIAWIYHYYYHDLRYKEEVKQLRDWVSNDRGGEVIVNDVIPKFRQDVLEYQDAELDFSGVYGGRESNNNKIRVSGYANAEISGANLMTKFENPLHAGKTKSNQLLNVNPMTKNSTATAIVVTNFDDDKL